MLAEVALSFETSTRYEDHTNQENNIYLKKEQEKKTDVHVIPVMEYPVSIHWNSLI